MISIPLLRTKTRLPTAFTDVVYVASGRQMPWEIRRLLRQKGLSFTVIGLDQFPMLRSIGHLIGTIVLDATDIDPAANHQVARTIEALESENIGVIVLTYRVTRPIRSFTLAPVRASFSIAGSTESVSIEDLWARISLNLSHRKKGLGMVCKPLVPTDRSARAIPNRLADRLDMAAGLIEELTEQMRLAGLVQRDFLPKQVPNSDRIRWAAAFQPAEWVSGDIYDIVQLDEDRIGFYVVDAVGHAMPAALLTIFVKQAMVFREPAEPFGLLTPAAVMAQLNKKMCQERLSGYQFATCCYCLLDTRSMTLTYGRAGHPYPLLLRPGHAPIQLEARGSLLGVFEHGEYRDGSVKLQRGDKVLVYSDGAEQLVGRFDDHVGFQFTESFLELSGLGVLELVDGLMAQTKQAMAGQGQIDDVTIVGLEVL